MRHLNAHFFALLVGTSVISPRAIISVTSVIVFNQRYQELTGVPCAMLRQPLGSRQLLSFTATKMGVQLVGSLRLER